MFEAPERTEAEFAAHISEETGKASGVDNRELRGIACNPYMNDIGCVDSLTEDGQDVSVPGGFYLLEQQGLGDDYLTNHPGAVLRVHIGCGHLFVNEGLKTGQEHEERAEKLKERVAQFNEASGANVQVIVERTGSALVYMT